MDDYLFVVTTHIQQRAREFSGVSFLRDIVPGLHPMTWSPPKAPLLRAIRLGVRILIPKSETYSVCNREQSWWARTQQRAFLVAIPGPDEGKGALWSQEGEILASRSQMPKSEGVSPALTFW